MVQPNEIPELYRDTHGYPLEGVYEHRHKATLSAGHDLGTIAGNNSAKFGPFEPGAYEFSFVDDSDKAYGAPPNVYIRPCDASFTPGATPADGEYLYPSSRFQIIRLNIKHAANYVAMWNPSAITMRVFARRLL